MKKITSGIITLFMAASNIHSAERITLKAIQDGTFAAERLSGIKPIAGTDQYARISKDGERVVRSSFETGKQTTISFDVNHMMGTKIDSFDGYIPPPDGAKMPIQAETKRIYRRSSKTQYYIYTTASTKLESLSEGEPQQAPVWSTDSRQIAFMRDNNIHLIKPLYDNAESQVTEDGKFNETINGVPDWVNEEGFGHGPSFCFNADGTKICRIGYDGSKVKSYASQSFKGLRPEQPQYADYPGLYTYKYPKAGQNNSKVTVWSYDVKNHQTRQLQVPLNADDYVPRIKSTTDPSKIIVYTSNRHQDEMHLYAVNPPNIIATLLIKECVPKYVKEEAMEGVIIGENSILLSSDRDGYMERYLYSMNGQMIRAIGNGSYDITAQYGHDEKTGDVYYQAAVLNAHDRQTYVSHENGRTDRLTQQQGWNVVQFSDDYQYFINTRSDYDHPYVYTVRDNKGKVMSTLIDNAPLRKKIADYDRTPKETLSFTTFEGVKLGGWMVKPAQFNVSEQHPVILFQYSGPGSQQVINSWNAGSLGQGGAFGYYLAQQGLIVVCVDGRGTGGRGSEFERMVHQRLGELEPRDQMETALWLGKQPYVDKNRIGIWGWSYGGFNTLMSMNGGRGAFKAGVAVAPPTDWRFYGTVYIERHMRTPKESPDGYAINPIERAAKLHDALLIYHGLADGNVHLQNIFEYAKALVQADKDSKEIYYTNRNHSIYGGSIRNHLVRQTADFSTDELK